MNNVKRDSLNIIVQGFYGNRTGTTIRKKNIGRFILGYLDDNISIDPEKKIDKTIIKLPDEENFVIIYNKYEEEKRRKLKERLLIDEDYKLKPLAVIPEYDFEIYSRCFVCRIDENNELQSLQDEDYEKIIKYLAE